MLVPPTVATPVSLMAPPVLVTARLPVAVVVPRMMPPVPSTNVTFAPLLLTAPTKLLAALPSVMFAVAAPLVAVSVLVPPTVATPVSVMSPPVLVTTRLPVAAVVPRTMPPKPSTKVTFAPLLLTVLRKSLPALFSEMSAATPGAEVAVRLVTPVTVATPVSVIAPPVEVTFRMPVTVLLPRTMPPAPSTSVTFAPLLLTAPTKLLVASLSVMS